MSGIPPDATPKSSSSIGACPCIVTFERIRQVTSRCSATVASITEPRAVATKPALMNRSSHTDMCHDFLGAPSAPITTSARSSSPVASEQPSRPSGL